MKNSRALRILISNDDGVHAPGLEVLEKVARSLSDDIWVVAPASEQSGAAHSLSLNKPLRAKQLSEKKFSVEGTPTDCVLMAAKVLITDRPPDLLLSGINAGENLADDVTYSGTVAAAMEGTLLGIPSVALSQCALPSEPIKWHTALEHGPALLKRLIKQGWPPKILLNINFPNIEASAVEGVQITAQGLRSDYKTLVKARDPRDNPYYWVGPVPEKVEGQEDSDLAAIYKNCISVTPLHLDLTHHATLKKMSAEFPKN